MPFEAKTNLGLGGEGGGVLDIHACVIRLSLGKAIG